MAQLIVRDLTKIYGGGDRAEIRALDHISFSVEQGEFVVILGASGAGKSTLLNILGGMDRATSGSYRLGNQEVTALHEKALGNFRRNAIGFVFQFYNLMPNLTALENVRLAASVVKGAQDAKTCLAQVGLEARAGNFPGQLSGGEQQRVAIARAMVKDPELLLCDEPTGALDSQTGLSIIRLLLQLCHEHHRTVIVVTHNSVLGEVADRLIRVADGKIQSDTRQASPKEPGALKW